MSSSLKIQEHIPLRNLTYFKAGGVGDYYVACHTLSEIIQAVNEASRLGVPYVVMGESSNMLVSDSGFPGLIIHNLAHGIVFLHDRTQVMVDSGTPLSQLVTRTVSNGYSGLEFLACIPGTIGGALVNNVKAFGFQISDYVKSATILLSDGTTGSDAIRRVDHAWFKFSPHATHLKKRLEANGQTGPVVLSVTLQLSKMNPTTCFTRVNEFSRLRKLCDPAPSASSLMISDMLRYENKTLPYDTALNRRPSQDLLYFLSSGHLRELATREASFFKVNPNFILNHGLATSSEARALITAVAQAIASDEEKFSPLINFIGPWDSDNESAELTMV